MKNSLKHTKIAALIILLTLTLAACGDPTATVAPVTSPTTATTKAAATAPAQNQTTTVATTTTVAPSSTTVPATTAKISATTAVASTAGRKSRIIEPTSGFPRKIEAVNGIVEIKQKPQRIHTLSVGYDEITFRLVDPSRIVAVGQSTVDPNLSNVADLAAQIPNKVGREAEQVIAAKPDLVVATLLAQISLESIIKLNPDYIVLSDSPETNPKGFGQLTANPALAEVPAIKNKNYFGIKGTYLSTLSQWNVRGIEELVKKLYPGQL